MNHKQEAAKLLAYTTRPQRYRLSGKTLRFKVYQGIEAVVAVSFLVVVALAVMDIGGLLATAIGVLVVILALGHFFQVAAEKPWLPMAAAFEAVVVWAAYAWLISSYVSIPHFGVLCVFLFAIRFWQRGEREVNISALVALENQSSNKAIEPTA